MSISYHQQGRALIDKFIRKVQGKSMNEQNGNQQYPNQQFPNQQFQNQQFQYQQFQNQQGGGPGYNNIPQRRPVTEASLPEEFKPISMWGYFGYELLFMIPCVGFILLLVFSFGGTKNVNLKNFARSYFCVLILVVLISVILVVALGGIGALTELRYYNGY